MVALMPQRGRQREVDFREVINAVRDLVRSGCGWRMLPSHFGAWQTVYGWFRALAHRFLFQTIHDIELMLDRERQGREASPSAVVTAPETFDIPEPTTNQVSLIASKVGWGTAGLTFGEGLLNACKVPMPVL